MKNFFDDFYDDFSNTYEINTPFQYLSYESEEECKTMKNKKAFDSGKGICYRDKHGDEYTRADLEALTKNLEVTKILFERLKKSSPQDTLEDSWSFRKCPSCGTYQYDKEFFHRDDLVKPCPNCRPVRLHGTFPLERDPYDDKRNFYHKRKVTFQPGITTIFGCNGSGKTTLFTLMKEHLKHRGSPFFHFDNTGEKGGNRFSHSMFSKYLSGLDREHSEEYLSFAVTGMNSSEGENVSMSLSLFLQYVSANLSIIQEYGETYILIDALDSGLSYDMLLTIKKILQEFYDRVERKGDLYILISSNSWEMSEGTQCFSISKMKYLPIRTYQKFCKEILLSARQKERRDEVLMMQEEDDE